MLISVFISIFKKLVTFKNAFICVYISVCECVRTRAYVCSVPSGAQGGQRRASGPLYLGLPAVECHQTWILRLNSAETRSAPNHWAIYPVSYFFINRYSLHLGSSIILKIIVKSLLGVANVFNRSRFDISIYLIGLLHDNIENHCFPILSVFSYTFIILYKS